MKNLLIILFIHVSLLLAGQQESLAFFYNQNKLFYNPAVAGLAKDGQGNLDLSFRNQWNGIDGAPVNLTLASDMSFFENKVGIGLSVNYDKIGIDRQLDIRGNYAYKLNLGSSDLSIGLNTGLAYFNSDFSKINNHSPNDPLYGGTNNRFTVFSIGLGLFYRSKNWYTGISVPTVVALSDKYDSFKKPHFYLEAGGIIGPDYIEMKVEPFALLKFEQAAPLQYHFGFNVWFLENIALSTYYRSSDAVGIGFNYIFDEQYEIGFCYEIGVGQLSSQQNNNSFQATLGYRFNRNDLPMAFSRNYRQQFTP